MKKGFVTVIGFLFLSLFLVSCEAIQNLPTNTTGGVFSLNGTWQLNSSSESNAMKGSTIQVLPIAGSASFKTIQNNTYCAREDDTIWKTIKGNGAGGFTLASLATACSGSTVYKDATINVINADQITLSSKTASNVDLVQDWRRIK